MGQRVGVFYCAALNIESIFMVSALTIYREKRPTEGAIGPCTSVGAGR